MLKKIENHVVKVEETISVVLFLSIVCVVVWSVLCRYVFKISFLSGEELARYLMIYCVFFGTSIGVKRKAHIGVEFVVQALHGKARRAIILLGDLLSFVLFLILLALSIIMMQQFLQNGQITTVTKVPMYLIFSCLPISMLLCSFHSFCRLVDEVKNPVEEGNA